MSLLNICCGHFRMILCTPCNLNLSIDQIKCFFYALKLVSTIGTSLTPVSVYTFSSLSNLLKSLILGPIVYQPEKCSEKRGGGGHIIPNPLFQLYQDENPNRGLSCNCTPASPWLCCTVHNQSSLAVLEE